ncbi:hypothetical protein GSI_09815 [Ganoderma sinense ZZ0214-1]|uniref:Transporter n=1 Tax=Ganoderma sinense ZZ0214-1 TaxID=1077348 RepID=A0A2G8S2Q2_9APHY|nr:hypothetical protein GSI_09815 [Ganoderma sinense ZZ0214-1]
MTKLFAILIESGAVYCAIWLSDERALTRKNQSLIVAYQISDYDFNRNLGPASDAEVAFLDVFGVIINGALVPIIAIYPIFIIVLVASNKSHVEKGILRLQSVQTPVVTVDTTDSTSQFDGFSPQRSSVLRNQSQSEPQGGFQDTTEDTSASTREEWKL